MLDAELRPRVRREAERLARGDEIQELVRGRPRCAAAPVENADDEPSRRRHHAAARQQPVRHVGVERRIGILGHDRPHDRVVIVVQRVQVAARQRTHV